MCYSGKCKYEMYLGDCTISHLFGKPEFPDDAYCAICDKEQEEYENTAVNNNNLPWEEGE